MTMTYWCPDGDTGQLVLKRGAESEHGYEDRDAVYVCTYCEIEFTRDAAGTWLPIDPR